MNRQELAGLLSQTQSMMAPSRPANGSTYRPASSLSPRQKFQAHIRTLSEKDLSPPRNASIAARPSPQLQHVSSLRIQRSESPSPTRSIRTGTTWRLTDEPQFLTEEREAWGRPSPLTSTASVPDEKFHLQRHEPQSPIPNGLRPFRPLPQPADIEDRPKTSRGPSTANGGFPIDGVPETRQQEQDRHSKFAEGSMNHRSTGISSTWAEHGSLASISDTDVSDRDSTPRASPERSSIDINEFNPQSVVAPSFAQRLFKFGIKTKAKDVPQDEPGKMEPEPQTVRKKKGLRKSMSMWNLHGDKKKAASSVNLAQVSPQKKPASSAATDTLDVLNDRKRRAEEAYAQQFGMKRRKSNIGVAADDHAPKDAPATEVGITSRATSKSGRRRLSWSSSTTFTSEMEKFDAETDVDLQKRPSRRELEKENQQLRAMLRQQQEAARLKSKAIQPSSPSSRRLEKGQGTTHNMTGTPPRKSISKQSSRETLSAEQIPAVPAVPPKSLDRPAIRPLSTPKATTQRKPSQEDLLTIHEDIPNPDHSTHDTASKKASAKHSRRASIVRGVDLPRPVSMILEQDEESEVEKKNGGGKENRHPLRDVPKLNPTPVKGGNKAVGVGEGGKVKASVVAQGVGTGVERENWEWPEDVF